MLEEDWHMFSVIGGSSAPCAVCRQVHRDLPRVLGTSAPDDWLAVSPGERLEAELTPDVCILPHRGATRHFIRGHIQLPLLVPDPEIFVWSVWVAPSASISSGTCPGSRVWTTTSRPLVGCS